MHKYILIYIILLIIYIFINLHIINYIIILIIYILIIYSSYVALKTLTNTRNTLIILLLQSFPSSYHDQSGYGFKSGPPDPFFLDTVIRLAGTPLSLTIVTNILPSTKILFLKNFTQEMFYRKYIIILLQYSFINIEIFNGTSKCLMKTLIMMTLNIALINCVY